MAGNESMSKITDIQRILFPTTATEWDGIWGRKSQAALDQAIADSRQQPLGLKSALASSFADQADLDAFKKCKIEGGYWSKGVWHPGYSDQHCFEVGDNGKGYWEDSTVKGSGPCVAITRSELTAKWGSVDAGKHKLVKVIRGRDSLTCPVKDVLGTPGRVDLNPDAAELLGLVPPFLERIQWQWADA